KKMQAVVELLRDEQALLVIDNMENLSEETHHPIYELLRQLPRPSKALLTSRKREVYVGEANVVLKGMGEHEAISFLKREIEYRNLARQGDEVLKRVYEAYYGNATAMRIVVGLMQERGYPLDYLVTSEVNQEAVLNKLLEDTYCHLADIERRYLLMLQIF